MRFLKIWQKLQTTQRHLVVLAAFVMVGHIFVTNKTVQCEKYIDRQPFDKQTKQQVGFYSRGYLTNTINNSDCKLIKMFVKIMLFSSWLVFSNKGCQIQTYIWLFALIYWPQGWFNFNHMHTLHYFQQYFSDYNLLFHFMGSWLSTLF